MSQDMSKRASPPTIPSALTSLEEIKKRVAGRWIAVFLDYDGTLTPIVDDPAKALIQDSMRDALMGLSARCAVVIISGRDLKDVQEKVGIDDMVYAGSHGFDIAGPKGTRIRFQRGEDFLPLLDAAEGRLEEQLKPVSGAMVERKKYSVAVHYRRVKGDQVQKVEDAVERVIHDNPRLKKTSGKKVFEVQPGIDWHKGKAMLWLMEKMDIRGDVVPFYIGDDTTDEDAFASMPEGGIGIVVMDKPRPTAALCALKNPGQVEQFIRALTDILKKSLQYSFTPKNHLWKP